jgi:ADP-heptose:LPS heptosyltransferase
VPGANAVHRYTQPDLPAVSIVEPGLALDCRRYRGDRPCAAGVQGVCPANCAQYRCMGKRILIIKLGALGDVIRTAALLPGLKAAWPECHITWVSRPAGVRMLGNHPLIDRLLPFDAETLCHVECEQFDLCLSLDKEPAPAALTMRVRARERRGIGLSRFGTVFPLNTECAEYFRLGLDDDFKFRRNQKTYQQLVYEAVGLAYRGQRYQLHPGPEQRRRAERRWKALHVAAGEVVIGLNTGAGDAFANKTWRPEKFARLARMLAGERGWRVALLGGPREAEANEAVAAACAELVTDAGGACVVDVCASEAVASRGDCARANATGGISGRHAPALHVDAVQAHAPALHELDFAALVERCNVLVTGDTMAMHVAMALGVPCVVLFGPTCPQEIDLYQHGTKVTTRLPCAPCYRRTCDKSPNCMDDIAVGEVLAAVEHWVGSAAEVETPVSAAL